MIQMYLSNNLEFVMSDQIPELTQRKTVNYTDDEEIDIEVNVNAFTANLAVLERKELNKGRNLINENQIKFAEKVVEKFMDKKTLGVMALAKTQSGKTGSKLEIIRQMMKQMTIPQENIMINTGISSKAWLKQTKGRFPKGFEGLICHQSDLTKIDKKYKTMKNMLLIFDEIQIAALPGQTISAFFDYIGICAPDGKIDKNIMYARDIKIIQFTATPDGLIYDLLEWGNSACMITMEPGQNYTGSFDLLQSGRLRPYKDLSGENPEENKKNLIELRDTFNENFKETTGSYSIIRTVNEGDKLTELKNNMKQIFNDHTKYGFLEFDQTVNYKIDYLLKIIKARPEDCKDYDTIKQLEKIKPREKHITDLNTILEIKPGKHIFISIKEMFRCSKTLYKKYIAILYERYTPNPFDSTIIQGLVGRDTGYDNNGKSICFTNIESVEKYEILWNSKFDPKCGVKWNSKTTTYKNDTIRAKTTCNKCTNPAFSFFEEKEPIYIEFSTQEEVKNYYTEIIAPILERTLGKIGRGPNKRNKPAGKQFYEATIRTMKAVITTEKAFAERRCGIKQGAGYVLRPAYRNMADPNSLVWCMSYYAE